LLDAFFRAASAGDVAGLVDLLAPDAVLITDGRSEGRVFRGFPATTGQATERSRPG